MPTRDIKTRFKLEGEQQYKKTMTDVANAVRVLNSEEKLARAEFEATGDAEQYAADQARLLKEKIEQQKKAVAAAEEAVKKLTEQGVKPSSKEMISWKTQLNNARTTLTKMETQLNKTESEIKDQSNELKNAKTALANAETKVESLNKEEKLAESQFRATGDSQEYASEKTRILNEKIGAQKEAVSAAETAIKSMTEKGVDPNSEEMVKWKDKLVEAKTSLANMETQLNETEKEIGEQTSSLGEAKKTMKEAEDKVKSLTGEEKLAEAQFKATGDKQQYASEKTRILKEKIEAQKKAVEAAESAIRSMTEKGIDPNSEEMVKWKEKLVEAKTKLANMETALNNTESELGEEAEGFGEAQTAAGDYQTAIEKVNDGINFQNTISAIDDITRHMETAVEWAGKLAKGVWDAGKDSASWADEIATAASQLGVDPETYQSWQYASQFIDTEVSSIVKSWQDITKNLKENNTEYLAELAKLGVATRDTNGDMRESKDIFWDVIDALHNIKDPQEQANKATEIFGNDWRDLKPLIDEGSRAYHDLAREGKDVAAVSNDNVEALGKVDDSMKKVSSQAQKLKNDALAALAPSFQSVNSAASEALSALQDFLDSAEGKEAVDDLNTSVADLMKAFLGEDNGKETFKAIVDGAKVAVEKFTEAVKWVGSHGNEVKLAIEGLAGAYASLKIAKGVLEFMQLLKVIPLDKLKAAFSGGSGGGGINIKTGGSSGSGGTSGKDSGSGVKVSVPGGILGKIFGGNLMKALGGAGVFAWMMRPKQGAPDDLASLWDENGNPTTAGREAGITRKFSADDIYDVDWMEERLAAQKAKAEAEAAVRAAKQQAANEYYDALRGDDDDAYFDKLLKFMEAYGDSSKEFDDIIGKINELATSAGELPDDLPEQWFGTGSDIGTSLIDGAAEGISETGPAEEAVADAAAAVTDAAAAALGVRNKTGGSDVFEDLGEATAVGFANGIYRRASEAAAAARAMAGAATDAVRVKMMIHSPSKVFEGLGEYTALGFAEGISGASDAVNRAIDNMLGATRRRPAMSIGGLAIGPAAPAPASASGSGRAGDGSPDTVHVTLMLDKEVLGDVMAPVVNDKIGASINATRR